MVLKLPLKMFVLIKAHVEFHRINKPEKQGNMIKNYRQAIIHQVSHAFYKAFGSTAV